MRPNEPSHRSCRRALAGKARPALLWGLAIFAISQVGLALAIERWLPQMRDPSFGLQPARLRQRLQAASSPPLTVVLLGSSRVQWGVRGRLLEAALTRSLGQPIIVYNLAIPGSGPVGELLVFQHLRDCGVRPDLLLVEVLPPSLSAGIFEAADENQLPTSRLGLTDVSLVEPYVGHLRYGLRREWWEQNAVPWFSYRKALVRHAAPFLLPTKSRREEAAPVMDETGSLAITPTTVEDRRKATDKSRATYVPILRAFGEGGTGCRALRDLLSRCRDQQLPTAMVVMPEGPECRGWYPTGTWQKVEGILHRLGQELGVPLVNAREWHADEEDFLDSHHLLEGGAQAFTERFGREAVGPLMRAIIDPGPGPVQGRLWPVMHRP